MKADWDKLMAEWKGSATGLVADVDCTADGKALCETIGVQGFPTIKYGDPNDLQDYQGGRKFEDLSTFAKTNLGPQCGPKNLDLCDDAKKADIAKFSAMSVSELEKFVEEGKATITKLEADFKAFVGTLDARVKEAGDEKDAIMPGLRAEYKAESEKKDEAVAAVKASGMGLAKSVKAFKASTGNAEL
jgi:hypothetical protein